MGSTNRPANTNFSGALTHRHQHDVHDSDTTDHKADSRNTGNQQAECSRHRVDRVLKGSLVEDNEFGVFVIDEPFGNPQITLHRRLDRVNRLLVNRLDVDYRDIRGLRKKASSCTLGDVHVPATTKTVSVVEHSNELESHPIDTKLFTQVIKTYTEVVGSNRAQHRDPRRLGGSLLG